MDKKLELIQKIIDDATKLRNLIKNSSSFQDKENKTTKDYLTQYLKQHCKDKDFYSLAQPFREACREENFWEDTEKYKNYNNENETFKIAHNVGAWSKYYYCVSNMGRVFIIQTKEPITKNNVLESVKLKYTNNKLSSNDNNITVEDQWLINISDGYMVLSEKKLPEGVNFAKEKDVYELVRDAGLLNDENKDEIERIAKEMNAGRLEIHHINNHPNDNRVENLMWLPKLIHQYAH